jgi:hypothetical protein
MATKAFLAAPAGKFSTATDRIPVRSELDGYLVTRLHHPLHCVSLRLQDLTAWFVGGVQVRGMPHASRGGYPTPATHYSVAPQGKMERHTNAYNLKDDSDD